PVISLTTDFEGGGGAKGGGYVAQMKAVILALNADAQLIDVAHDIPPQDVAAAAWLLRDVAESFGSHAIHVVVVDPGVGSDRALLAVTTPRGIYLAPDNGVLTLIIDDFSPIQIRELHESRFWRSPVRPTFHGRDILAPVAGHLSLGVPWDQLGPPRDEVNRLSIPQPHRNGLELRGEIVRVDSFGNLISNITRRDLEELVADREDASSRPSGTNSSRLEATGVHVRCGRACVENLVRCFADATPGALVALVGSADRLEIAVVGGHAADELGVGLGTNVQVSAAGIEP
ncbi:MAG TPA: SAM-dependent chlorinase/fluorinase, partial [Pirellulaceae bacterium]